MRAESTFIAVEVDDATASTPEIARKLDEVCPVDIFDGSGNTLALREHELDECVLCGLCYEVAPKPGSVKVLRLYADGAEIER